MSNQYNVFADNIGRTIISEVVEEDATTITVRNPAVIAVQPNPQTGQITVQIIPYLFKEFVSQSARDTTQWAFNKAQITRAVNIELDDRLVAQYKNMYSVIQTPTASLTKPGGASPVIKLFDE